ncbi:MAG: HAD family hydrolase [Erysipelothrix sp.]|nr:HAD family hydrolase [Erysipelothrix sp.]
MKLRKKCLILDHDDTIINSQESIHYPLFVEVLKQLRPNIKPIDFERFIELSNEHGFVKMCRLLYHYTPQEIQYEYEYWRQRSSTIQAPSFNGLKEVLTQFVDTGGKIIVYTMNAKQNVIDDYERLFNLTPDVIIAHDSFYKLKKPYRLSLLKALDDLKLNVTECVFIDDTPMLLELKDRLNMDFIAANWAKSAQPLWKDNTHETVLSDPLQLIPYLFDE